MTDYTFEVTEDHHLRFTLKTDDRTDVYTSTDLMPLFHAPRVISVSIADAEPPDYRTVTFKIGADRESMEQLGATSYVAPLRRDK